MIPGGTSALAYDDYVKLAEVWQNYAHFNRRITYRLTLRAPDGGVIGTDGLGNAGGYDPVANPMDVANPTSSHKLGIANTYVDSDGDTQATSCPIEIVEKEIIINDNDVDFTEDAAIFETEPKETADLNIFHEISDTLPVNFFGESGYAFAPVGTLVSTTTTGSFPNPILPLPSNKPAEVVSWEDNIVKINTEVAQDYLTVNNIIKFSRLDGSYTTAKFGGLVNPETINYTDPLTGSVSSITVSKSFYISPRRESVSYV